MGAGLKLTPQQIEALVRLRASPDFKHYEEAVREYEGELLERVVKSRDRVVIHQAQGGIEAIRALKALADSAPEALRKTNGR